MTTLISLKFDVSLGVLFTYTDCLELYSHILCLMADFKGDYIRLHSTIDTLRHIASNMLNMHLQYDLYP